MLALFTAVFLSSLLGSTHCAGMCGAFVAFAVGSPDSRGAETSKGALNAAYNCGRLLTYLAFGAAAGALGAALDLGGSVLGIQRIAAGCAGAIMAVFGVVALLRHFGVPISRLPVPVFLGRIAQKGHERAFAFPPVRRALAVGLLTTFLPCGWLYAFVVIAAGTASSAVGMMVMAAFWLGTLPMMATLGLGLQVAFGPLRRRLPLITGVVLVAAGLWTLFGRLTMPAIALHSAVGSESLESSIREASHVENPCPLCVPSSGEKH